MKLFEQLQQQHSIESEWDKEIAQLVSSLAKTDNIELKTDLDNPGAWVRLLEFGKWADSVGFDGSYDIIKEYFLNYCKTRVSYKRQGRLEIVKAISAITERIKTSLMGRSHENENNR